MKKFLCMLLCAALLLSASTIAMASGYGRAPSLTLNDLDGGSTTMNELSGSVVVLVFGRLGETFCSNTDSTLNALNDLLSSSNYSAVKAYFLETESGNTAAAVRGNAAEYSNITACVTDETYRTQMWNYLRTCDSTITSTAIPVTFFIDKNGNIADYCTGAVSALKMKRIFAEAFGLENEDEDSDYTAAITDNYVGLEEHGCAGEYEWEVLRLTNKARMQNGLLPLSTFDTLQKAAGTRADELVSLYSHTRPSGEVCYSVLDDLGLSYSAAAENIAAGYSSPAAVVIAWLNSSGHYENIMRSTLCHMGVGYDEGGSYGRYWGQLFMNDGCSFDSMELLNTENLTLESGESIDNLGVVAVLHCENHGLCYMPVIEEMCSGYDEEAEGSQVVSVTYGSLSATFSIANENAEDGVSGADAKLESGKVIVTAQYKNSSGEKVFAAGYCDGELIDVKEVENGEAELDARAEKVKVFMWETLENMRPVGSCVEMTVEK